ncbi:hypothetical protein LTR97_006439 [Elasticomyces elasticus]|uniref:Uncharacterized protein n=1 Tax=Elasticomyces elasticus TaxID=574655 RepID=A0AAN7VRV9_9PEZI|nr:hypothetical protein LTR97_006439 [Elasticomyces elasticus]
MITGEQIVLCVFAIFIPTAAVAVHAGLSGHILLNIFLWFVGWAPAVLHAWAVILLYVPRSRRPCQNQVIIIEDRRGSRSKSVGSGHVHRKSCENVHSYRSLEPTRESDYKQPTRNAPADLPTDPPAHPPGDPPAYTPADPPAYTQEPKMGN